VIESFRHRGLKRLYEHDDPSKLFAEHVNRIRLILAALDAAKTAQDLNVHTFRLHPLKGERKGLWAVTVRANWRIVFRFEKGKALDIDLVDYH
jgi:proteic killer suppression protein